MARPIFKTKLPDWNEDSPAELFALFQRYRADDLSSAELEHYTKLLWHVVAIRFNGQDWWKSLPRAGLVPEDVFLEVLAHILRKSKTLVIKFPGPRPLLGLLNGAIRWFVLSKIAGRVGKVGKEIAATDFNRTGRRGCGVEIGVDRAAPVGFEPGPDATEMINHLRSDRVEDEIIGDIKTRGERETAALHNVFGLLVSTAVTPSGPTPWFELQEDLRDAVSPQLHALLVGRVLRHLRRYAA